MSGRDFFFSSSGWLSWLLTRMHFFPSLPDSKSFLSRHPSQAGGAGKGPRKGSRRGGRASLLLLQLQNLIHSRRRRRGKSLSQGRGKRKGGGFGKEAFSAEEEDCGAEKEGRRKRSGVSESEQMWACTAVTIMRKYWCTGLLYLIGFYGVL